LGFNNNNSKVTQNVSYSISKVDTLLALCVIIGIFLAISAYFIGKRIGILEEKISWAEEQKLEDRKWRLNVEKEFPTLKELLIKRELAEKKE
jgi:hypothetical protein